MGYVQNKRLQKHEPEIITTLEPVYRNNEEVLLAFRIPRTQYGSPVIQKMFVFLGIGEKGGTGADVITKGWKDNGWSIPTVEEKSNPDRIETCLKLGKNIKEATETPADTTETILEIISNNPKVTAKELASVCGITEDGVAYHIKKLKQRGRLIRIGGSRNGGEWKVVE